MSSENQSSVRPGEFEFGIDGGRKSSSVSGGSQTGSGNMKSDSFVVEVDRFCLPTEKDINGNSRITLQRNLSRKGSGKCGEKKTNSILGAIERDACMLSTSPRATLHGSSTPEKPTVVVALGATDHSTIPQPHHQITINGSVSNTATESKCGSKRFSFRRYPPSLTVDPRRILFLFATLSSIGTIILIYFTLSMTKINGDENALN
ncbi:uncharacterized protein LOC142526581 isoform X1 [Primulina tabacum]|uniref:uncharacterized protein LOC142526581 isoform X1 n=1 Tax=Primulina tabacum TaxID=48773 RepID=UPI003F5A7388